VDENNANDGVPKPPAVPATGTLIRRLVLGSAATYRILGKNKRGIEVEVVDAPGLRPGARFTFTSAAVMEMTDLGRECADHAVRRAVPKRGFA
jgi:hypothetical protein